LWRRCDQDEVAVGGTLRTIVSVARSTSGTGARIGCKFLLPEPNRVQGDAYVQGTEVAGARHWLRRNGDARRRWSSIRVLLTSGYGAESASAQDTTGSDLEVLRKPYKQLDLAHAVREAAGN